MHSKFLLFFPLYTSLKTWQEGRGKGKEEGGKKKKERKKSAFKKTQGDED